MRWARASSSATIEAGTPRLLAKRLLPSVLNPCTTFAIWFCTCSCAPLIRRMLSACWRRVASAPASRVVRPAAAPAYAVLAEPFHDAASRDDTLLTFVATLLDELPPAR